MKILYIEDDIVLRQLVEAELTSFGPIEHASSRTEALSLAENGPYRCAIVDLNLPDGKCFDILHTLRARQPEIPIIITSAEAAPEIRIDLLEHVVDDYVLKPFLTRELRARVIAQLRKPSANRNDWLVRDDFRLEHSSGSISYKSKRLELKRREFFIMRELIENFGETVPTSELIARAWQHEREPFSNSLDVHICSLRKKLREHGASHRLINRKAQGYALT